ncbi:ATP-grasp domain-containing protein [Coprobacter tertius]|uniref:ATP-grasp domain-containing protein n=1 Tax=Coprobacter tertius TaxID=2944915 RepID=A0ABT1MN18_9BACT|nr:ATP-grasp domain-containing protein [Coprobacter tertius]MCP9612681.1 ATP-grasp domain-containing protein [Coprobacter tertius]
MKKIAILGASKPHLQLYTKAREMGVETYCFAWKEGAYCKDFADHYYDISITDKEAIARVCRDEHIDGILSNALEIAVPTMAYVSEKLGLNGISYETACTARNKYKMREKVNLAKASLQPAYRLYKEGESPDRFPVIVKPTDGSCSNGVTKVEDGPSFVTAIERALSASSNNEILIEECIEGREISVESLSFHGRHYVLMITDKETTGAPYFVETAHHQPTDLPGNIQRRVRESVVKILDAIGIENGASHTEFKIDRKGNVYFIEIGARGGGDFISYDLVLLSTGYDYVKGMIEVALNEFTEPNIESGSYSGVYFLGEDVGYVKDFIEKNSREPWVYRYEIEEAPLKKLKKSQDRTGYIIYQSDHRILIPEKKGIDN